METVPSLICSQVRSLAAPSLAVPASGTPEQTVESILTWMAHVPARRVADDPDSLAQRDPEETLMRFLFSWYGDRRLGVSRMRFPEQLRRAGTALLKFPEVACRVRGMWELGRSASRGDPWRLQKLITRDR